MVSSSALSTFRIQILTINHINLIPHINHKEYIRLVADFVFRKDNKQALIIGGPKHIGKTTGLYFFSEAARSVGYQVFNVDLKTSVDLTDISTVLENLAWDIADSIIMEMDDGELHCIYEHVLECPAIQRSWAIVLTKLRT